MSEANPQTPLCTTRTDRPSTWLSARGVQGMITEAAVRRADPLDPNLRVAAAQVLGPGERRITQRLQRQRKETVIELGHDRSVMGPNSRQLEHRKAAKKLRTTSRCWPARGACCQPVAMFGAVQRVMRASRLFVVTVAVRVIPCLDVHGGRVVKGVNFVALRDAGDPVELAACYDAEGADELTFLDISASAEGRETTLDVVRRTAETRLHPAHRRRRRQLGRRRRHRCCGPEPTRSRSTPGAIRTPRGDRRDHPSVRQPGAGPLGGCPPR